MEHSLVLVTCGSDQEARAIARHLVSNRLAAGVQIVPISSIYTWEEEIVEDHEVLLICKTRSELYPDIESSVQELHSYEVAPILQVSIDQASEAYLDWIDSTTLGEL